MRLVSRNGNIAASSPAPAMCVRMIFKISVSLIAGDPFSALGREGYVSLPYAGITQIRFEGSRLNLLSAQLLELP